LQRQQVFTTPRTSPQMAGSCSAYRVAAKKVLFFFSRGSKQI